MFCSIKETETWRPHITVRGENKQYYVTLGRRISLLGTEKNELHINGEMVEHGLVHNRFSPICGAGGEYEWEIEGHKFLLVFNVLSCRRLNDHRLFVDGIDVHTGLEYSAYWKRRGFLSFIIGGVFILAAIAFVVLVPFPMDLRFRIAQGAVLAVIGLPYCLAGLIVILKHGKPRYEETFTTADQSRRWPDTFAM